MTDERIKAEYDPSNLDAPTLAAVELRDVVKSYGKKRVLDSVSYRLEPGSVFALLGENGAGKTTTIKMLLGETKPDSGKINVFQLSPEKHAREIRERTGYVPEQPVLYGYMTVAQMGKFAAAFYPEGYMAEYAKRCEEFGLSPNDRIKNLSKGGRAKTSLALALAGDPDLLILDEPTSGLDALVRRQFLANIADLAAAGKTVFLSSHQTPQVERVADRVAFLRNGKIVVNEKVDELKKTTTIVNATIVGETQESLDSLFNSIFEGGLVEAVRYGARWRAVGRRVVPNCDERLKLALGEKLTDVELVRPTLEDVFVAYMEKRS